MPSRVSPTEQDRASIDELFADPDRDLGRQAGHSADHIADALVARGTPVPRASVYNVLGALSANGLVMVADAGPGRTLFEVSDSWHHHFVCRSCGEVRDVQCAGETKRACMPRSTRTSTRRRSSSEAAASAAPPDNHDLSPG